MCVRNWHLYLMTWGILLLFPTMGKVARKSTKPIMWLRKCLIEFWLKKNTMSKISNWSTPFLFFCRSMKKTCTWEKNIKNLSEEVWDKLNGYELWQIFSQIFKLKFLNAITVRLNAVNGVKTWMIMSSWLI